MAKRVLFDLASARRVISALAGVAADSGAKWQIGLGTTGGKTPHAIAAGTDGSTTVVWCEQANIFDGCNISFWPTDPELLGAAMLGNEAFIQTPGKNTGLELSTDGSVTAQITNMVTCDLSHQVGIDIDIPSNTTPAKVLCSTTVNSQDAPAFLAGLGVLFGFGDRPGLSIQSGKIVGYAVGKTSGSFEVSAEPGITDNLEMYYTLERSACMAAIATGLACGVGERKYSIYVAVVDTSPTGGKVVMKLQCGPVCVWAPCVACPPPVWVDYLPGAVIESVQIDRPSLVVMLSSFASACFAGKSAGNIRLKHSLVYGLEGAIDIPGAGGNSRFLVEVPHNELPEFNLDLTRNQVLALSYAVSSGDDSPNVNLSLGDGDELLLEASVGRGWTIRLK